MMRKSLAVVMTFVLMVVSILPGVRPVPLRVASAYAPPPPTLPTPASPSVEPEEGDESPYAPPSPDELAPEVEKARARQAIEGVLEKYLRYWGPRYQVAPLKVAVEGEWAYGVAQWRGTASTVDGPLHVLAHRSEDGAWQALMPSEEGLYLQWVEESPERLVPAREKGQLRAQAAEADALQRPQATPVAALGKEGPSGPIEPILGPVQPTVTLTSVCSPVPAQTEMAEPRVDSGKLPLTQGWRVYSNEMLKFSILYPDGWFVHEAERSPDVGVLIDFTPMPVREPGQVVPSLWIEVISKPVTLGLDDWIETYVLRNLAAQIRSSVTIHSYQLGGNQGFEITGLPGVHRNLQYFFAASEQIYRITISPYEPENSNFENALPNVQRLRDVMLPSLDIPD